MAPGVKRGPYTPAERKTMIRMRTSNVRIVDIAIALGRSYTSVRTKLSDMKIVKPNIWDDWSLTERLLELRKNGDKFTVIAAELGMRDAQIAGRVAFLKRKGLL